jgi:hypothetical protein
MTIMKALGAFAGGAALLGLAGGSAAFFASLLPPTGARADNIHPPAYAGGSCSAHFQVSLVSDPNFSVAPCPFPLFPIDFGIEGGPGEIVILMPNFDDDLTEKRLRIQVTGLIDLIEPEPGSGGPPVPPLPVVVNIIAGDLTDGPVTAILEDLVVLFPCAACEIGNAYFYEDWQFLPNPDAELITITFDPLFAPTEIIIDTVSLAETSPLAPLALGAAAMALLRRRLS